MNSILFLILKTIELNGKNEINYEKTNTLQKHFFNRQIKHNNILIPWSNHIKNPNLTLDNKLTYSTHVQDKMNSGKLIITFPFALTRLEDDWTNTFSTKWSSDR